MSIEGVTSDGVTRGDLPVRVAHALGHTKGVAVFAMPKDEWRALIHHGGEPTIVSELPADLASVQQEACYLGAAVASVAALATAITLV